MKIIKAQKNKLRPDVKKKSATIDVSRSPIVPEKAIHISWKMCFVTKKYPYAAEPPLVLYLVAYSHI